MTNNKLDKYQGVIPAFYACYDGEGNICEKRARAFARYLRDAGVRGLYVNGSSGECIYLSVDERKKVLEAVMDEVGKDLTIIAHVACNSTRDSVELARHAESLGVDAIAAIPPIYFKLSPGARLPVLERYVGRRSLIRILLSTTFPAGRRIPSWAGYAAAS